MARPPGKGGACGPLVAGHVHVVRAARRGTAARAPGGQQLRQRLPPAGPAKGPLGRPEPRGGDASASVPRAAAQQPPGHRGAPRRGRGLLVAVPRAPCPRPGAGGPARLGRGSGAGFKLRVGVDGASPRAPPIPRPPPPPPLSHPPTPPRAPPPPHAPPPRGPLLGLLRLRRPPSATAPWSCSAKAAGRGQQMLASTPVRVRDCDPQA
mmetsp:Transcript_59893/g.160138  ORF Transcript_59893/g.160138 Transcript_59893/m.160138 type:complete len:208 (-) Transcript_59893:313-936(-)